MRKFLSIALFLLLVCSLSTVAMAENTTTLTTTVPDATYTLNIPADQEIPFGEKITNIGNVTLTDTSGFAEGKDLQVTLTYEAFKADGVSTTIPFELAFYTPALSSVNRPELIKTIASNESFIFEDGRDRVDLVDLWEDLDPNGNGWVPAEEFQVRIKPSDWGKTLAGEYSSTITFTAEVVISEP